MTGREERGEAGRTEVRVAATTPAAAERARQLADSFQRSGGAEQAAELLIALSRRRSPTEAQKPAALEQERVTPERGRLLEA